MKTTHAHPGPVVVFHIGMTLNRWWRPDHWLPVFLAMPAMLRELEENKAAAARGEADDLGFLGATTLLGPGGPSVLQHWRSVEQLYAYARDPRGRHTATWRRFNALSRRHPGSVGIWHETYVVPADGIETFYGHGTSIGLGKATGVVPVERRGIKASERLGSVLRDSHPAP